MVVGRQEDVLEVIDCDGVTCGGWMAWRRIRTRAIAGNDERRLWRIIGGRGVGRQAREGRLVDSREGGIAIVVSSASKTPLDRHCKDSIVLTNLLKCVVCKFFTNKIALFACVVREMHQSKFETKSIQIALMSSILSKGRNEPRKTAS